MAVSHSTFSVLLVFSFAIVGISIFNTSAAVHDGFTVELIHRDSPKSPLSNPSETRYQRLANALRRTVGRARLFSIAPVDTAEAPIVNNRGEYLMKLSLGTPPFPILAIADTGSNIVWSQCLPCSQCYPHVAPLFDPSKSATYRKVSCSSPMCSLFGRSFCTVQSDCHYSISYGDGSHSRGDIAAETVTLGSTSGLSVSFPQIVIGCGKDNGGTFEANVSGIVGLGRGSESLVSQLGISTGGKFSYCLAPISSGSLDSSKLSFGSNAVVSGPGTVSTPITAGNDGTFYRLMLEAISVGGQRLEFQSSSSSSGEGNIIIDSGTTLTLLPSDFYPNFASAVIDGISLERMNDPNQFLNICFKSTSDNFEAPAITIHFQGADVPLSWGNVFIRVAEDVVCLAFVSVQNSIPIFGNIAHTNFLTGYDIKNMILSFKPADCAAM